jgi:hypothetical protein
MVWMFGPSKLVAGRLRSRLGLIAGLASWSLMAIGWGVFLGIALRGTVREHWLWIAVAAGCIAFSAVRAGKAVQALAGDAYPGGLLES